MFLPKCSLYLSATKTVIAPKETTIQGWHWHIGAFQANPHRIAILSSCQHPKTVTALRPFIDAYKFLFRVDYSYPLGDIIAGGNAKDTMTLDNDNLAAFTKAQKDISVLAGFFSATLRHNQRHWLSCEIEALDFAAAIKHFSPFNIQSRLSTCVLTNSKSRVQDYKKLCRSEF